MGIFLTAFNFVKGNKLLQYALMGVAAAGVLLLIANHYKHQWKEEGKAEQKQEQVNTLVQTTQADRAQTASAIATDNVTIAKGSAIVRQADPDIANLKVVVQQLIRAQADIAASVQKIPEAKLHDLNRALLNGDQPAPPSACYPPTEERAITLALQTYQGCQKTIDKQAEEQRRTEDKLSGMQMQIDGLTGKYDHLSGYTGRLEGAFTTLVNLYPKKKRGAHCLWIAKCNKVVLPVPNIQDLK